MKAKFFLTAILIGGITLNSTAQKYFTKNGSISFFSKTNMEDIKADNNQVMSVLNAGNGQLQFSLLVKSFHFDKALMEEHFNENYLESDKYPKSTFTGTITDITKVNFAKEGVYTVSVTGDLNIHGVSKTTTTAGTVTVKAGNVSVHSKFIVKLSDYSISVPKLVKDNISQNQEVTVSCNYDHKM
jgi:polyisoprenoid-binding protein YceI